jgi:Rps23 Pro-64 3,4-dihydroxylase Tpa1-like proline 4-hydroxylase
MNDRPDLRLLDNDVLQYDRMQALIAKNAARESFATAKPFRHIVFEGLFSDAILNGILDEYREVRGHDWLRYDNNNELKRGSRPNSRLGPSARAYFNAIHSGPFVEFLSHVTGITGLLPDPTLWSGGLHEVPHGGKFAIHIDFNRHPVTLLENRLVFITYLNHGWLPSYGGALELWNPQEEKPAAVVQPVFGNSILFYQSPTSWHGHPDPVNTPDGGPRRSVAAYYYTNGRSDHMEEISTRTTVVLRELTRNRRERVSAAVRYVTPPIIFDLARTLKEQLKAAKTSPAK